MHSFDWLHISGSNAKFIMFTCACWTRLICSGQVSKSRCVCVIHIKRYFISTTRDKKTTRKKNHPSYLHTSLLPFSAKVFLPSLYKYNESREFYLTRTFRQKVIFTVWSRATMIIFSPVKMLIAKKYTIMGCKITK